MIRIALSLRGQTKGSTAYRPDEARSGAIELACLAAGRLRLFDRSEPKHAARVPAWRKTQHSSAVTHEPLEAILGPNEHGRARHLFDRSELLNRHF
jgi:hypothetical protein